MAALVLDAEKSSLRIHTFAEGLFARLAHDLELRCRGVTGTAERSGPEAGTAKLEIAVAKIEVAGTLKDGRVDPRGLSPSDREDCLAKMRSDVFQGGALVRVEGTLEGGKARLRVVPPSGRAVERSVPVKVDGDGDGVRVSGTLPISLNAIGSATVKGPMNAFRVKDVVEVVFEAFFAPA